VPHRQIKAYTPQTNGMVERFNGRVASDVPGINVAGHADLEILLTSFNRAYNRRRQRGLQGLTPIDKVAELLKLNGRLENKLYKPPADQDDLLNKVDRILYYANEVSQPDT
jgi:transposase InsO family protein